MGAFGNCEAIHDARMREPRSGDWRMTCGCKACDRHARSASCHEKKQGY